MYNQRKILLPAWIWDSTNNDEFKERFNAYMKRSYPEVTRVVRLEKPFVIVER